MAEAIIKFLKYKNDLVARYDTNSLAVILENVSHQQTELLVKSIRKKLNLTLKIQVLNLMSILVLLSLDSPKLHILCCLLPIAFPRI